MAGESPGPWSFKKYPWLLEMHNACDMRNNNYRWEKIIGKKGAQLGYTEWALNVVLKMIDMDNKSVLYVLPATNPDASDFSTSRFDPALELSPHLARMFSDVQNVMHKRAGAANLFIRGSRSRSQMKSLPVDLIVFDELDEMVLKNVTLAWERMSGRSNKLGLYISTPTHDDIGIDAMYKGSTRDKFNFKCPGCGKYITLEWPDNFKLCGDNSTDPAIGQSHMFCTLCGKVLQHELKSDWLSTGMWVSEFEDRASRGFHVNQLYSPTVSPVEIARTYFASRISQADTQEFFNSKIGICYTAPDARITDADILACMGTYGSVNNSSKGITTLGVDVGSDIHYEVNSWTFDPNVRTSDINLLAKSAVIDSGTVKDFEGPNGLDGLMHRHNINYCVIDKHPETRKAREFCTRWWGRASMCLYIKGLSSKAIVHDQAEQTVRVDRTAWMDLALGRVRSQRITFPKDTSFSYKEHLKAPVRSYSKDDTGNPVAKYVTGENAADHSAHARVYAEVALPLACSLVRNQDINKVFT
jgi:hypothetical protein